MYYEEFKTSTAEATEIAALISSAFNSNENKHSRIAVISDDQLILQKIKSELSLSRIPSEDHFSSKTLLNSVAGDFIRGVALLLANKASALEPLLNSLFVAKVAPPEFLCTIKNFIKHVLHAPAEFVEDTFVIKQKASFDELISVIKWKLEQSEQLRTHGKVADFVGAPFDEPANFRWLGILEEMARISRLGDFTSGGSLEDFIKAHELAINKSLAFIMCESPSVGSEINDDKSTDFFGIDIYPVPERIDGRSLEAQAQSCTRRIAQTEQHRAPTKVTDFVGAPFDEPANFRWLSIFRNIFLQNEKSAEESFSQYSASNCPYKLSWDEYLRILNFFLTVTPDDWAAQIMDALACSSNSTNAHTNQDFPGVLLLTTASAMEFNYDVAFLPSMSENIWYKKRTYGPLLFPKENLSEELDIFNYMPRTVYITRNLENNSVKHRFIGPLSKPSKSEFWEGDTEHRSGAYLDVREHSSTGSTYPKTDLKSLERGPLYVI
ncbi:MAG: palindromic element RPE1 domain-containing protein [Holosporales bacterium]|nr:palindromic element RPE1 domain-containing protein [Holosporales bacterium]